MQQLWSASKLGERWPLLSKDLPLLAGRVDAGKARLCGPARVLAPAQPLSRRGGGRCPGGCRHRVAIIDHLAVGNGAARRVA